MLLKQTISLAPETNPTLDAALDQTQLYARGLEDVRRFSRRLWTDHNTHDPGITILELLCYALTDLSYRAQFPLSDLLATPSDNSRNMASQFFSAGQVLPCKALTALDFRKLLIDLKGVRNAWISPAGLRLFVDPIEKTLCREDPGTPGIRPFDVRGLYQVRIEYMDEVNTEAGRRQINEQAMNLLMANRNLCEDFVLVEEVRTQYYSLCAELELTPAADPTEVAAQIAFRVDQYLAPPLNNHQLEELLNKKHDDGSAFTVDEIFDGPRLTNGFLDDHEVANASLRTEVRLSDLIRVIMSIDGVLAVRDIVVNEIRMNSDGTLVEPIEAIQPLDKWRLPVPAGRQPRISGSDGRLVFYKRNLPQSVEPNAVAARLAKLRQEQRARFEDLGTEDVEIPLGRNRNTASYSSFQLDFPVLYGLSEAGLPSSTDPLRRAQALQLKGFLLFFDQVMANYLAQLSQINKLFSRDSLTVMQTCFSQVVRSIPQYEDVYSDALLDPTKLPAREVDESKLPALETNAQASERRNRILDHLLARVAEVFHHYVSIMRSAFGTSEQSMIDTKAAFLNDYPALSSERGLAFDYSLSQAENVGDLLHTSGLERRLVRLLGLPVSSRRNLTSLSEDIFATVDETPESTFEFRVKHRVSGKELFSSRSNYATAEAARMEMGKAIMRGQIPNGYQRQLNSDGRHFFCIVDADRAVLARSIEDYDTGEALEAVIVEQVSYLREQHNCEGMYLIENILLRPQNDDSAFLPICIDPKCTDCADDDPYSYRLNFILPAYAGRFQNMDFRCFVEETIRLETPAHILPRICWVDVEQMAEFERVCLGWFLARRSGDAVEQNQQGQALIETLFRTLRNVYPKAKLHNCGSGDEQQPFILGRSQLGNSD